MGKEMIMEKSMLIDFYINQKKSLRKIALELNIPKTTPEYYFKKFNIKRRTKSEAGKCKKEPNWCKGLNKIIDIRVKKISLRISEAHKIRRELK